MSPRNPLEGTRYERMPGWDLVGQGLGDLEAGRRSETALLVSAAPEAMASVGLPLPGPALAKPERGLYELVKARVGESAAHGQYNALRRTLYSFLASARRA